MSFHSELIEILINNLDFVVTVILLIANLSVAILIGIQMMHTNKQFIDLNRPWLHLQIEIIKELSHSHMGTQNSYHFPLILENSGNLTATNIKIITNNDKMNEIIKNSTSFELFRFDEFFPNFKKTLLETVTGLSSALTDIITITLSYEFSKTKIIKNYYLYQGFNVHPVLSDIKL